MTARETLQQFVSLRYSEAGLIRLAGAVGLDWDPPLGVGVEEQTRTLLLAAERDGMAPALLAGLEQDFPFQLPLLEWAGATGGHADPVVLPVVSSAGPPRPSAEEIDAIRAPLFTLRDGVSTPLPPNAETEFLPELSLTGELEAFLAGDTLQYPIYSEMARAEGKPFRFVHGYTLPPHWARRETEIGELAEAIRDNRHAILALVAIGGTGKSALTRKLLDDLPQHNVSVDGALWFSFYVEPDFDRFLAEACRYLIQDFDPREHPSPHEKSVLLREAMAQGHYLLVLDGIEVLLVSDRSRKDFGSFHDRAGREFLDGLADGTRSQVLISSRFPIIDLAPRPHYREMPLGDLSLESADELLLSYGVRGTRADRAPIFTRFGTHALTLQTLGHYLVRYQNGEPDSLHGIQSFAPDAPQGIRLQAVLDGIWQQLIPEERFFLTRMSAFRGGVDERSLIVLNKNGDNFSSGFREMVQGILMSPLVSVERREGHARLTSHPLIKTFFYERMGDSERDLTHRALKDYAQGLPLPDKPRSLEDYQPLLEACHHCLQVGLYTEAYQIYRRNNMDNALRWWGHYSLAQALLEPLREASQGDLPAWQSERWQRSWVENETALLALLRGDLTLAIERFEHSAEMDSQAEDGQGQSASLHNLASALIQRGDFQGALEALEHSREIERKLGRYEKQDILAGLEGICQAELGQVQQGFDLLSTAIDLSAQEGNPRALCYWLWRAADICLYARRIEPAKKRFAEALRFAEEEQFRDYNGHILRGQGDAALLRGQLLEAGNLYAEALRLARTLGNPYLQNEVHLSMARLAEYKENLEEMHEQAQQALTHAQESGYRVQEAEANVLLARHAILSRTPENLAVYLEPLQLLLDLTQHAPLRAEYEELLTLTNAGC